MSDPTIGPVGADPVMPTDLVPPDPPIQSQEVDSLPTPDAVPTWLCTFTVLADFPSTMHTNDMEGAIAYGISQYLNSVGMPANCSVTLVATAGNASVADPTKPIHLEAIDTNIAGKVPPGVL